MINDYPILTSEFEATLVADKPSSALQKNRIAESKNICEHH